MSELLFILSANVLLKQFWVLFEMTSLSNKHRDQLLVFIKFLTRTHFECETILNDAVTQHMANSW